MAGLMIKDIPERLHAELKRRAVRNHRSMTREAIAILESALAANPSRPTLAEIDRMRVRGKKLLTEAILRKARAQRPR